MKIFILAVSVLISANVVAATKPDRVGGSAKADFSRADLSVPCVLIQGLDDQTDGMYFDIVLKRRGNSFNYELVAAAAEDTLLCERIAEFARYEDDDYVGEDEEEDEEDEEDGDVGSSDLFAQCTVRADRSSILVKAKKLESGEYVARVSSGLNSVDSAPLSVASAEVEVRFDSDADAIIAGAEGIEVDFIMEGEVTAELFVAGEDTAILTSTVNCLTQG